MINRTIHSVSMLKAAFLTLGLFLAFVHLAHCTDGHSSYYGVKLCGREFIRAVIFTCGGSRWRRSVDDSGKMIQKKHFELKAVSIIQFQMSLGKFRSTYLVKIAGYNQ